MATEGRRKFPRNPMPVRPIRGVRPEPMAPRVTEFTLGAEERFLFDLWAQEHTHILGTKIEVWSLDVESSKRDALYDEPIVRAWKGPFAMKGFFEWADSTPEVRDEGIRTSWSTTGWISRKDFEDHGAPPLSEGDVIRVWDAPFFKKFSVDDEPIPTSGYFFDVINVNDDGHLWDQYNFVGYSFTISRRTESTPERRLENK